MRSTTNKKLLREQFFGFLEKTTSDGFFQIVLQLYGALSIQWQPTRNPRLNYVLPEFISKLLCLRGCCCRRRPLSSENYEAARLVDSITMALANY